MGPTVKRGVLISIPVGILIVVRGASVPLAQSLPHTGETLVEFFKSLVEHFDPSSPPSYAALRKAEDGIPEASDQEIIAALPVILTALGHKNRTVSAYAGSALFRIATRPDGADLLRSTVAQIGQHLQTSLDQNAQRSDVMILVSIRPSPPPEVATLLLSFLRLDGRDPTSQVEALGYVVSREPGESASAAMQFLRRSLDDPTRIAALNTLANTRSRDRRIMDLVVSSLSTGSFEVRLTAFEVVNRMGPEAIRQAATALQAAANGYMALLKQENGDVNRQIQAMEALLLYAPEDPGVADAVEEFYSRRLEIGPRTSAQNALRIPHLKNIRLIDLVIGSLKDPDPRVRANAALAVGDMGPFAVERAEGRLKELVADPQQPDDVRDAAKRVLGKMRN